MKTDDDWTEIGRTETIQNNQDPTFERAFNVDYVFDDVQAIRFELYDSDKKSDKLSDHDFLGHAESTVAEVVSQSPVTIALTDKKGKPAKGTITLRSFESVVHSGTQDVLTMSFRAEKLDKMDTMGKSDPLLEFHRKTWDDKWELVHRTEFVKNNLSPTWKPVQLKAHQLSGGDYSSSIRVDCLDWDSDGTHDLIGSFTTSVNELINSASGRQWPCINQSKVGKKKYEKSGTIFLTSCEVKKE